MTSPQRFERDLPILLEELYVGRAPDYRDDLVGRIGRTRQRPAWAFPGRWLHMDLTTERVPVAQMPWRAIGLVALVALLLAASLAVYIGSQPRLPDPFGLASNGQVAYSTDGDIYTADPVTGVATALVSGPERDLGPRFSRDGTTIAFERRLDDGTSQIYRVDADGGGLTLLTPEPMTLTPSPGGEPVEQYPVLARWADHGDRRAGRGDADDPDRAGRWQWGPHAGPRDARRTSRRSDRRIRTEVLFIGRGAMRERWDLRCRSGQRGPPDHRPARRRSTTWPAPNGLQMGPASRTGPGAAPWTLERSTRRATSSLRTAPGTSRSRIRPAPCGTPAPPGRMTARSS